MLTDRVAWQKFSLAGRERACREFDLANRTRILEAKYEEVIERWLSTGVRTALTAAGELPEGLAQ
jgi:hypothetical protein